MEQYLAGVKVLLTACARGALADGEAAARFLYYRATTLQKHPSLAYGATKAAAMFAALAHDRHRALTVSLATAGMELTDTLELRARTPPRPLQLPGLPTKVFVYATGAGCATVQGTISYSTYTPKPENSLLNIQAAIIEEIRPERSSLEDLQGNLPTLNIKNCFRWKGKERSGILRLEVSLFSGYELHSVNPVVLDGASFADLHYGSRGESIWFVFANISSTCPVCVTYQARSHFVITSLRPAFAKIYPSTRPDLAVETFFHATAGSPLLRGITDDDFITWFDKTELASLKTKISIDNICECGRICSNDYKDKKFDKEADNKSRESVTEINTVKTSETAAVTEATLNAKYESSTAKMTEVTTAASIPLSSSTPSAMIDEKVDIVNLVTTTTPSAEVDHNDPIIIPTATFVNKTDDQKVDNNLVPLPIKGGELIIQKVPSKITMKKDAEIKKKPLPRRKGTLKSTYGDKHEKFFAQVLNNSLATNKAMSKTLPKKTKPIKTKETINLETKTIYSTVEKLKVVSNKVTFSNDSIKMNNTNVLESTAKPAISDITTKIPQKNMTRIMMPHSETATVSHVIAAVTNSNLRSIFHRTKKPKSATQIKKPDTQKSLLNTEISINNETSNSAVNITSTKSQVEPKELHYTKPVKSINKEIHKIPNKPISETSQALGDNIKPDIAPENREGFEILDKNHIWQLLKEGSDVDTSKIEDKLKVHSILKPLNFSSTDDNRSL
ncbi:hypothetical protein JYU34_004232 [Plutella xylostella]|uniref:Alpha-macroglobulin receptor-binding domain-containing protein n=1 Tax=Plutella xylostella TaxID=51655 RepID=A0ABQ7QXG2_PLUXY|nr:hypothetical protein JYU34_004232 [Plutella xylostella]